MVGGLKRAGAAAGRRGGRGNGFAGDFMILQEGASEGLPILMLYVNFELKKSKQP